MTASCNSHHNTSPRQTRCAQHISLIKHLTVCHLASWLPSLQYRNIHKCSYWKTCSCFSTLCSPYPKTATGNITCQLSPPPPKLRTLFKSVLWLSAILRFDCICMIYILASVKDFLKFLASVNMWSLYVTLAQPDPTQLVCQFSVTPPAGCR